jgi:hypothetical protein
VYVEGQDRPKLLPQASPDLLIIGVYKRVI